MRISDCSSTVHNTVELRMRSIKAHTEITMKRFAGIGCRVNVEEANDRMFGGMSVDKI